MAGQRTRTGGDRPLLLGDYIACDGEHHGVKYSSTAANQGKDGREPCQPGGEYGGQRAWDGVYQLWACPCASKQLDERPEPEMNYVILTDQDIGATRQGDTKHRQAEHQLAAIPVGDEAVRDGGEQAGDEVEGALPAPDGRQLGLDGPLLAPLVVGAEHDTRVEGAADDLLQDLVERDGGEVRAQLGEDYEQDACGHDPELLPPRPWGLPRTGLGIVLRCVVVGLGSEQGSLFGFLVGCGIVATAPVWCHGP